MNWTVSADPENPDGFQAVNENGDVVKAATLADLGADTRNFRKAVAPSPFFFTWSKGDYGMVCDQHPSVGVKGDTPEAVAENIRRWEEPYVKAAESERAASELAKAEQARVAQGKSLDGQRGPHPTRGMV